MVNIDIMSLFTAINLDEHIITWLSGSYASNQFVQVLIEKSFISS